MGGWTKKRGPHHVHELMNSLLVLIQNFEQIAHFTYFTYQEDEGHRITRKTKVIGGWEKKRSP